MGSLQLVENLPLSVAIHFPSKTPTPVWVWAFESRPVIDLDDRAGLHKHPDYSPVGRPRPGIHYEQVGTLHGDGTFEPTVPVQPGSLLRTVVRAEREHCSALRDVVTQRCPDIP